MDLVVGLGVRDLQHVLENILVQKNLKNFKNFRWFFSSKFFRIFEFSFSEFSREKSLHTPRDPESWRLGYQSVVLERSEHVLILAAVEGVSFLLILYWGSMIFSEQILSVTSTRFSIVALTENRPMVGMKTSKNKKNDFFQTCSGIVPTHPLHTPRAQRHLKTCFSHRFCP